VEREKESLRDDEDAIVVNFAEDGSEYVTLIVNA
jgi:hypothetical protein